MHTTFARERIEPTRASCEEDVAAKRVLYANVLSAKREIGENEAGEIVDRLRPDTLSIWTGDRDFGD